MDQTTLLLVLGIVCMLFVIALLLASTFAVYLYTRRRRHLRRLRTLSASDSGLTSPSDHRRRHDKDDDDDQGAADVLTTDIDEQHKEGLIRRLLKEKRRSDKYKKKLKRNERKSKRELRKQILKEEMEKRKQQQLYQKPPHSSPSNGTTEVSPPKPCTQVVASVSSGKQIKCAEATPTSNRSHAHKDDCRCAEPLPTAPVERDATSGDTVSKLDASSAVALLPPVVSASAHSTNAATRQSASSTVSDVPIIQGKRHGHTTTRRPLAPPLPATPPPTPTPVPTPAHVAGGRQLAHAAGQSSRLSPQPEQQSSKYHDEDEDDTKIDVTSVNEDKTQYL